MQEYHCKRCGWSGVVSGRPRCLECYRRRAREWRKRFPEKAREQGRKWEKRFRTERREEYNARRRRKRSSERNAEMYRRRKEWLLAGDCTRLELVQIFEKARGRCHYCRCKVCPQFNPLSPRGFDHVQSRDKKGQHTAANIVVCCRQCNECKG